MQKDDLSTKIIRNTMFNIIGHSWSILVALILTPYIISHIGVERFGFFAIVGVLSGYFGLFDFGIGASFVKYIAEFYSKQDYKKINQIVNSGFIFYSIFAILIIALTFFTIKPLLTIFKIPSYLYNEALFVLFLGIILFALSNMLIPFRSIQDGLQRMDISNKVAIAISIPKIIGTIYFLEAGYGLPGLMINNGIILGISSIINFIIAFKIFPELRFSLSLFSRSIFKKLFSFGYKLQIARVSTWISGNIDKLLISYFLSIGWVTFYELGSSIVDKTKSVVLLFVSALIPAFSEIDARGERKKLIDGYIRGTKYITLISAPLFIFIIVSARQIMMIWLGAGYETSARIIQILSVGWFFAVLSVMRAIIVQAIAKPEIEMKSGLAAAILNIPLSIIFIIQFGFVGVALGTSISLFLSVIYAIIKLHKELRLSVSHFIKTTILKTVVICICIGLFVWVVTIALQGILSESSRITSLIIFIIQVVLFFAIYFYALLYTKPFDNVDVMLLVKDKPSLIRQIMIKFSQKDR